MLTRLIYLFLSHFCRKGFNHIFCMFNVLWKFSCRIQQENGWHISGIHGVWENQGETGCNLQRAKQKRKFQVDWNCSWWHSFSINIWQQKLNLHCGRQWSLFSLWKVLHGQSVAESFKLRQFFNGAFKINK